MNTKFLIFILLVYLVFLIPAIRVSIAFWLYRDQDDIANKAMSHGFLIGFISIWLVYPVYVIKDCFKKK